MGVGDVPCRLPSCGLTMHSHCTFLSFPECDEDHESIHGGMEDLAGSSATKKTRARKLLKSPSRKVSWKGFITFNWQNTSTIIQTFLLTF